MKKTFKRLTAVCITAIMLFTNMGFAETDDIQNMPDQESVVYEEDSLRDSVISGFEFSAETTTGSVPAVEMNIQDVSEEIPYEFDSENGVITGYKGGEPPESIVIPETIDGVKVKGIGVKAFYFSSYGGKIKTKIKSVQFPEGLEYIDEWAFQGNLIEDLIIPDSVTEIRKRTFWGNKISSITLSKNLVSIGDDAFEENLISDIELPSSLESIGSNAFKNNNIGSIILPENLKKIGSCAFTFNAIDEIEIPDSVNDLPVKSNRTFWRSNTKQADGVQKFTKIYTSNDYVTEENTQGIVNPASVTLTYVSEEGKELKDPVVITGKEIKTVQDGKLIDGSGRMLQDYKTPSNNYKDYNFVKELSDNYFKIGSEYEIEAEEIPGYSTPEPVIIKLEKENTLQFVYPFAGTKKLTLNGSGLSSSEYGDIGINAQVKVTILPPVGQKIDTFMINGIDRKSEIQYKELEYSYSFKMQEDTLVDVTYTKDETVYDEELKLEIDKTNLELGEKAQLSAVYRGEAVDFSASGITWSATPEDVLSIDSNTGEVRAIKSGTVILTGMMKNRPEMIKSFNIDVASFAVKVRVEANNRTIAPSAMTSITSLDLSKYGISTKFTEPKPIHAIIYALENTGIDCTDSKNGISHGGGSYISMIDGLKTYSTSYYDGWMYYVNNQFVSEGVGD